MARRVENGPSSNRLPPRIRSKLFNHRSLLAVKAAVAVGIAWELAQLMPGVLDDYPYYAPLGALLCMHHTVAYSFRYGLQILIGLGIGLVLATGVLLVGDPNLYTISLVVAAGVLIGSFRWLGAPGREYLPMAALFVLIVGGQEANIYSIGYMVQMTTGIVVGLIVNALLVPPLAFSDAIHIAARFRNTLAVQLEELSDVLTESWPPERDEWAARTDVLTGSAREVRSAVHTADESRKANLRAYRHRRDITGDYSDLQALENITFHIRDLSDVLAASIWGSSIPATLPEELRKPLSEAIGATAEALRAWNEGNENFDAFRGAQRILDELSTELDERHSPSGSSTAVMVMISLRRILAAMQDRVEPAPA